MNWVYTPNAAILHITAFISLLVGALVLSRRNTPGGIPLAILIFSIAEWSIASGLEAAVVGVANKLFWSKVEYLGVVVAPTFFLIFTLEFTHQTRWIKKGNLLLLFIVPLIGFIGAATNWHKLIWTSFTPLLDQPNSIIYGHGVGYFVLLAYNYLVISVAVIALLMAWLRARSPYRDQLGILLLGSIFPYAGGILYSVAPRVLGGLDIPPVSFSFTSLFIAFGILRYRLFDLVPVPPDMIIDSMEEGILVLDTQNRIVDINPVAQDILNADTGQVLGQPAAEILKSWPVLSKFVSNNATGETEFIINSSPPRHIHLNLSSIHDRHGDLAVNLLVMRDVTQRHRIQAELNRKIEELGILNNISLAVTSGLDMEHVLKALHEQCNQVAKMDIFYVALYDEANSLVHVPLFYERGQYQVGPTRDIKDHPGFIGKIIRERKTLVLNGVISPDTRPVQLEKAVLDVPANSYVGIPLVLRERVVGVMSVQSYFKNAFNEDQIRILERIAVQAAIAVENARLYSEVQRLAIIDELTGIYNYRGLIELGSREVERAVRFHRPLAVLFFDIDDFRSFNNRYNHATGNIVLKSIAQNCRMILRSVDILTRFGGDEFVALLPETDMAQAEAVARRMVMEINGNKIATSFGELSVTISVGLTVLTDADSGLPALIDRANHAEHKAKQGQKGIVVQAV
jgi:diguanylate cyclase (GGDEF)-like protein/PAS domain S-box-containing protein